MQTYRNDTPIEFFTGEPEELSSKLSDKIISGEIDRGVIAKMPEKGKEVEINGLKFRVQQVTKSHNVVIEPIGKG